MNFVIDSKLSRAIVLTCSLIVVAYGPALADENEVEIEADLAPCASPCVTVPGAKGELEYEAEFLSDGVTIKEAKVEASVKIPIPNSLGIDATNGGTPGLVKLELTRPNATTQLAEPYATCTMVLKSKSGKVTGKTLKYALKVSAYLKNGQFVAGKKSLGSCDIDLVLADVQPGIPAIQDGDIAFVVVNDTTDILSALLETEHEDEDADD